MALADAYADRGDWVKLETLLQNQKWGDVDFIRLAHLTRAAREQKQDIAAQGYWQSAVRAAGGQIKPLTLLSRLAASWKMESEREDLLWTIVRRFPAERWALQALTEQYLAEGNTRGVQKVYATIVEANPDDLIAKNNLAAVDLLLNSQLAAAREFAFAAYTKYPKNSVFASTYAFSLYRQNRIAEALKVFESLPPNRLETPSIACYYGVVLAAAGESNKAKKYLNLASGANLLPEEKDLLKSAR
jgi:predicted Zn-dependent protease